MTTQQTYEPMTEAEVHAFAAKTSAWFDHLAANEQALFRRLIQSAARLTGDDLQGYAYIEYGQTFFTTVWQCANTWIDNNWNLGALDPHTATPVSGSGGRVAGSPAVPRLMN